MCGISSVYKDDCVENAATATATIIHRVIGSIKVCAQDTEWELDELVI